MTRFLLLTLALMCENVNAAPQEPSGKSPGTVGNDGYEQKASRGAPVRDVPVGAAPFTIVDPMCQTGFTIAQRYDTRNAAGTIIKSVWVRKCTKGRVIYGKRI